MGPDPDTRSDHGDTLQGHWAWASGTSWGLYVSVREVSLTRNKNSKIILYVLVNRVSLP
jgi:hypothetical protein